MSVYLRNKIFPVVYKFESEDLKCCCCLVADVFEDVAVCAGYKSPSTSYIAVKHQVEETLCKAFEVREKNIIMGDFNIFKSHPFFKMLESKSLIA